MVKSKYTGVDCEEPVLFACYSRSMTAEETFEREMRPLRSIQDNYEKIVLTLDRFSLGNYDGIKVVNVIAWLLG